MLIYFVVLVIQMMTKLRSKLIHAKVYLNRALGYASIVNMGLILFLTLSNLEKYGMDIISSHARAGTSRSRLIGVDYTTESLGWRIGAVQTRGSREG